MNAALRNRQSIKLSFLALLGIMLIMLSGTMVSRTEATELSCSGTAQDAVVWGFPLMMAGRYLDAAKENGIAFNRFYLSADIASPKSSGVGSNIDTLNGLAWIDLSNGPQVIAVPDTGDRYYTIQLQDMYMNSFAYIGRRTTGTSAGFFALTPPGYSESLPSNIQQVPAPSTKVLAFLRTLVHGPEDVESVRAINRAVTIGPLAGFPAGQVSGVMKDDALNPFQPKSRLQGGLLPHSELAHSGAEYFQQLDHLLQAFPPHDWDRPNLEGLDLKQLQQSCSSAELAKAVEQGVELAVRSVKSWPDNGWLRRKNVAAIVKDPLERAANNVYGPGTQIAEESIFFNLRLGSDEQPLSGEHRYRLFFPAGELPPVDAFWSLTLYDNRYYIFDNSIDRYGITDRTEGLVYAEDGSLEILIQASPPEQGVTNWLPAPQAGFQLVFRTYQPRQSLLTGQYHLPPLEYVDK